MPTSNPNKVAFRSDGTAVLTLERRDGSTLPCVIDAADYALVRSHRWSAKKKNDTFYVRTDVRTPNGKKRTLLLHRLLLPDAKMVDHKDGDGLNNQRTNLRPATASQNGANRRKHKNGVTSKYRGVSWNKRNKKFVAQARVNGKLHHFGYFISEEDAALVYNAAALQHFGEFAKLNDIQPARLKKAA